MSVCDLNYTATNYKIITEVPQLPIKQDTLKRTLNEDTKSDKNVP
jgi:hypothetical protein